VAVNITVGGGRSIKGPMHGGCQHKSGPVEEPGWWNADCRFFGHGGDTEYSSTRRRELWLPATTSAGRPHSNLTWLDQSSAHLRPPPSDYFAISDNGYCRLSVRQV